MTGDRRLSIDRSAVPGAPPVAQLDNRGVLGEGETRALRIANEAQAVDCVGPVLAVSVGAALWGVWPYLAVDWPYRAVDQPHSLEFDVMSHGVIASSLQHAERAGITCSPPGSHDRSLFSRDGCGGCR